MTATRNHWASKLSEWYAQAIADVRRTIQPHFSPMKFTQVRWQVTNRASRKAGVCWAAQSRIWLHAAMTEAQALSTFRHELAHLWSFWYENDEAQAWERHRYGHGPVFRKWAQSMGDDGSRCHNYTEVLETKRGEWAHCPCGKEFKQMWRGGNCAAYHCKRCKGSLMPGRMPDVKKLALIMKPTAAKVCAEVAADTSETVSVRVRSLVFELGLLREGGLASSPEAKKIRVMLRKLDPEWRTNG